MGRFLERVAAAVPGWIRDYVRFQGELGDRIRRHIQARGLTQAQFAEQAEMKPSQLSVIVAGNANLTLKTIFKLQGQLGVRLIELAPAEPVRTCVVPFQTVPAAKPLTMNAKDSMRVGSASLWIQSSPEHLTVWSQTENLPRVANG